jgi:hypothetical protein
MQEPGRRPPERFEGQIMLDRNQIDDMLETNSPFQPLIVTAAVALIAASLLAYMMDITELSRPLNRDPSGVNLHTDSTSVEMHQPAKGGGWIAR